MLDAVRQFVERMGLMCEKDGMPRGAGRLFGLLLAEGGPFSLDELAERLRASKASVSTNSRLLEQMGMIERVSTLGDRRDYYRARCDPWESMLQVAQTRWREMAAVFDEAAAGLSPDNDAGRRRLRDAERFHRLLLDECDGVIRHWREVRDGDPCAPDAET
jgi:DNA-binding transcriptional regulator GbsR (MarR family)